MTKQGTINLVCMAMLPLAAVIAAALATANGVWNAYTDTYIAVFAMNGIVAVLGGLFSWLFLRRSVGAIARWIAILPMLLPAVTGSVYYLWFAVAPAEVGAGAEFLAGPQYLVLGVVLTMFIVLLARLTRIAPRGI